MTVNYTTNLALGQPVTGTESGTWGDDVNNAVTSYLDIAIAGGLSIAITTADVTLANTQGTNTATNIGSTTAQYAILNVSGAMTAARNLILPSSSRQYVINNNTTGGFALTVKGSATSGVTMVNGEKAHVFWNGTDYSKLSNTPGGAGTFSSITNSGLTSGRVVYSTTGGLETDSANLLYNGADLTVYGIRVGRGLNAVSTNTALGASALASTTGSTGFNTAVGYQALTANLTGEYNTAVGYLALATTTNSSQNTATGYAALKNNAGGSGNSAFGYGALTANTSSSYNTAIGTNALQLNSSGNSNTAVGEGALASNISGTNNTGIGSSALYVSTGSFNTAVGQGALYSNTSGSGNTAINPFTAAGSYAPVFDPTTQNNRFCMGSTAVTNAYIQVAWTVVSDARDKTDFAEVPHGLDFVINLKPTAYRFKETRDATEGHGPLRYGFKAQDVLALEGDTPVIVDADNPEKLYFNDQSMIAVLVKAIQELKAEFDAYKLTHP